MEQWIQIPGYEDTYSVSNSGRIRIEVKRHNIRKGTMLSQCPQKDGYLYVTLRRGPEREGKKFAVSRLVLIAFVGHPEKGWEANHENGDIVDNHLSNLNWCTKKKNLQHSIEVLGHTRKGEKNPAAKLTEDKVIALRESSAKGEAYASLGRRFGISLVMARNIATGRSWKHVGGPIIGARPMGRRPSST